MDEYLKKDMIREVKLFNNRFEKDGDMQAEEKRNQEGGMKIMRVCKKRKPK